MSWMAALGYVHSTRKEISSIAGSSSASRSSGKERVCRIDDVLFASGMSSSCVKEQKLALGKVVSASLMSGPHGRAELRTILSKSKSLSNLLPNVDSSGFMGCMNEHAGCGYKGELYKSVQRLISQRESFGSGLLQTFLRMAGMSYPGIKTLIADKETMKIVEAYASFLSTGDHVKKTNPFCDDDFRTLAKKRSLEFMMKSGLPEHRWTQKLSLELRARLVPVLEECFDLMALVGCELPGPRPESPPFRAAHSATDPIAAGTVDWLERGGTWTPSTAKLAQQIMELYDWWVRENDLDMSDIDLPPEISSMWRMAKASVPSMEPVFKEARKSLRNASTRKSKSCDCKEIRDVAANEFIKRNEYIGINVPKVADYDKRERKQEWIDIQTRTDVASMGSYSEGVVLALQDQVMAMRQLGFANMEKSAPQRPEGFEGDNALVVKTLLVYGTMYMLYCNEVETSGNLNAEERERISETIGRKGVGLFFFNIIWAVYYQLDEGASSLWTLTPRRRAENIALGLLSGALAMGTGWTVPNGRVEIRNEEGYTDFMVAVYTVWNYQFIEDILSNWKVLHLVNALGGPIVQSITNFGDISHWLRWRIFGLANVMSAVVKQGVEGDFAEGAKDHAWWEYPLMPLRYFM